jgi:hypothetical protein
MKRAILLSCLFIIASCGSASENSDEDEYASGVEERGGETFSEYDERRDSYEGANGTYQGDGCTEDCSGHDAGYEWAEDNGIDDPDNCGGNSWSFEEGCRAYAEEN